MRDRVERLRIWMVGATALLVVMVAGFLVYQHSRSKAFLAGLPKRLGAEITRETNEYTYSQTIQGRTVFTLHAAKMEQKKDGVVRLHNVGVVLYGRKQDRADRIYGDEFEYDQAKGVVRALGVVHMDLQAPAPVEAGGKKQRPVKVMGGELATGDPRVIHVMTSGLVYLTNLGVAATKEDVEFSEGALTGRATGADYSSDTGVITLASAVRVNGVTGAGPLVLTASRAELKQAEQVVTLEGAKVVTSAETVEAANAVVHVRKDGSPEKIEGSGRVVITRPTGGVVTAREAETAISAAGKAQDLRLWGGVQYAGDEDGRKEQGTATEARVQFDGAGAAEHVTATGDVRIGEREVMVAGPSSRTLTAQRVEMALGAGARQGSREVRTAEAIGGARLVVVDEGVGGATRTEMMGDDLNALIVDGRKVSKVVGSGHTVLHQVSAAGMDEVSSGDRTELAFRTDGGKSLAGGGLEGLESAVQVGSVSMVRKSMGGQGGAMVSVEERAAGDRAVFEGEQNRVTLTGAVMVMNAESTLWASRVVVDRGTGDTDAEGPVRMNYRQAAANGKEQEPVHVLASRAELRGGGAGLAGGKAHVAFFYGVTGRLARMWQGSSQVEAPVIELEEAARRLTASGKGDGMQVHTVLVGSGENGKQDGGKASAGGTTNQGGGPSVIRIMSREMVYTDGSREVVFRGGVVVDDADGRMKAQEAAAQLAAAGKGTLAAGKAGAGMPDLFAGGSVERVVATGRVDLEQPGRRGFGEKLVYTASDGNFVLTGTQAVPPRVEDEVKGTVTGGALRFHRGDDSVVVTSEGIQSGTAGPRRRTETKVKQ